MYFEVTYLKDGKKLKKVVEAKNFLDASKKFKSLKIGIFMGATETDEPLEIKIEKLKQEIKKKMFNPKIDLEEYVAILEQIYVMLDASLSLNDIITDVSENIKNKKLKEILDTLNQDIRSGLNVSASLKKYEKEWPFYHSRHLIAPGITGWAQVNYPYGQNLEDTYQKLMYDLYYIKNWSLWLEIKTIFKTIWVMVGRKGL